MVNGVSRLFPVDNVKVVRYLPDAGADVVVIYPSYDMQGTIDEKGIVGLLTHAPPQLKHRACRISPDQRFGYCINSLLSHSLIW